MSVANNYLKSLAQTGRTSRMLERAESLAREGRAVYVLSASRDDSRWLQNKFGDAKADSLGIKFSTAASLGVTFDWERLRVRGSFPNCVFLLDHSLIESRFSLLLEELHRYDVDFPYDASRHNSSAQIQVNHLLAANAAMLHRWAIIHNLLNAGGDIEALSVAGLSAAEFVQNGAEYGAERLLRQERSARALIAAVKKLDAGEEIKPGYDFHMQLKAAVSGLSSYPQRVGLSTKTGDNPVD